MTDVLCDACSAVLIPTRRGWVCPGGCGYEKAGRLWRDLPPSDECQP